MGKCTKKMWDIHATDYSAMRKEYIPPFVTTWMDLKYFVLSKTSQTEKDKYCVIPQRRQWHPTPVQKKQKIPWTEEPGGLQSMGSLRVGHDFTFTSHFHALEKEMATHSSVVYGI